MTPRHRIPLVLSLLALVAGGLWFGHSWLRRDSQPSVKGNDEAQPKEGRLAEPGSGAPARPALSGQDPAPAPKPFETEDPLLHGVADASQRLPLRLDAIKQLLAQPLPAPVLEEVIAFLSSEVPADAARAERERALRNALLNRLREHPEHMTALVPALAAQAANPQQDPGLRDYALQHLAVWVPKLDEKTKEQAIPALQNALRESDSTYAGTALVGLNDLWQRGFLEGAAFDPATEARRIAQDDHVSVLSRLTALALASELRLRDDALVDLAHRWSAPTSSVPEGARRAAQAFLITQASLH